MTDPKKPRNDDNEPATKGLVRNEVAELAQAVKVGFDNTVTKDDLKELEERVDKRFDRLEAGQGKLKAKQGKLEAGQDKLEAGQDKLEAGQDRIERRLDGLMDTLDENNQLLKGLPERVKQLEQKTFPHR